MKKWILDKWKDGQTDYSPYMCHLQKKKASREPH